jgi:hypothetical protein
MGVDERRSCFAQLGFSDRPRRGRLRERSTPTMIAEPLTCLVRPVRSFAAMINQRTFPSKSHGGLRVVPNIMIIGRQLSGP